MTERRATYGSLFSGVGGLEMGVQTVIDGSTIWHSDVDPGACEVLAHRFPNVPNLGDITAVDWNDVPRVDILTGGSPCQDVSSAGRRAGMSEGTRSNLWVVMREAIEILHPALVVWENVRGALSARADSKMESRTGRLGNARRPHLRALGRVLGDLADLGYDTWWCGLRAADVGAPHNRFRVFVFAIPTNTTRDTWRVIDRNGASPADATGDGRDERRTESAGQLRGPHAAERSSTPPYAEGIGRDGVTSSPSREEYEPPRGRDSGGRFGKYQDAIARWEDVLGRRAPDSTVPGVRPGQRLLNAEFASWMMGYPEGWITDTPGIRRAQSLKCVGNGVVPQQAAAATRWFIEQSGWRLDT